MPITLLYSILVFTTVFLILESKTLLKRREFKELIVAILLLALADFYGMDYALGWQRLPNPNALIILFQPVSESFDKFFQVND